MAWPGTRLDVARTRVPRRQLLAETAIVLLLSLGASAIWSALSLLRTALTARATHTSISQQTSTLNSSRSSTQWLDVVYQLVQIALALVPVALVVLLLSRELRKPLAYLGIDRTRQAPDAVLGALLAAVIGIPGLALYLVSRAMGINTTVVASGLGEHWWVFPILVLAAAQNAILEEVVMVAYLFTRWGQAGWGLPAIIVGSALIRGGYHLYQGFGGGVGNLAMGVILGVVYARTRRVMPLVIAHTILDVVAFVGYTVLRGHVSWL